MTSVYSADTWQINFKSDHDPILELDENRLNKNRSDKPIGIYLVEMSFLAHENFAFLWKIVTQMFFRLGLLLNFQWLWVWVIKEQISKVHANRDSIKGNLTILNRVK